ncbi:MAG: FecR domain-containing protein [Terracidiphilus sp.]|nr:FecR domain-containing protein [Terracidiphilus sp.]MDR3776265.1 FecR domain-containing protein [Terracidiphilus sp.]
MKMGDIFHSALLTALLCAPTAVLGQFAQGQAFTGALPLAAMEGAASAPSAPDSSLYAEGTRAINEGRWADAVNLFTRAASMKSDHADGALYWKAYAENRQGKAKPALETCQELRSNFPKSRWLEECGALEIEIHAKIGKPVQPKAGQSDELKLLALNFLMRKDESRALAEIQDILNSDASQKLKDGALFILGQHHSDETYPQIVRLSEVEGDVRITRGGDTAKTNGAVWEKAVAGLPLETGFSLVTGAGRAEIEFENASTLYLGENSVLSMNDLHTTGGVPYTELALLSGTVSLDVRPYVAGEWFIVRTPTDNNATRYPDKAHFRLTSYMDAIAITPLENGLLKLPTPGQLQTLVNGQTLFYREGKRIDPVGQYDPGAYAAWDKWVADRLVQRNTAMAQVMKESGLKTPIPGLADLKDKGRFFDCPPYGTCFEPTASNNQQQQGVTLAASQSSTDVAAVKSAQSVRTIGPARSGVNSVGGYFPCMASLIEYRQSRGGNLSPMEYANGYDWAMCHAGSWIIPQSQNDAQQARYVWVPSFRRHHLAPVHWIKAGHQLAFVPIHPYDVKGHTPVNSKGQVFAVNDKHGLSVEPVKVDSGRRIELLNAPPKEFRTAFVPQLPRADAPHIEAHLIKDGIGPKSTLAKGGGGIPLSFDHKSQTFGMVGISDRGNSARPTFAPVNNRGGNLQGHPGGFGGGGYSAGAGGSHGGGGYSGGSSSSGGGGGGGYSGGAAHSSGGGSSVSSSPSVSSAPSSSAGSSSPSSAVHQ